jgi:hypothetical protein
MEELATFIGEPFFRGRLDEFQCETYDRVRRERERMPTGPSGCFLNPQGGDSPFGPAGLVIHNENAPHPTAPSPSSFTTPSQELEKKTEIDFFPQVQLIWITFTNGPELLMYLITGLDFPFSIKVFIIFYTFVSIFVTFSFLVSLISPRFPLKAITSS